MRLGWLTLGLGLCAVWAAAAAPHLDPGSRDAVSQDTELAVELPGVSVLAGLEQDVVSGLSEEHYLVVELTPTGAQADLPLDLALVVDTSGSMIGPKLAAAKDAMRRLSAELGPRDTVSIVAFSDSANTLIERAQPDRIGPVIGQLVASGGTNVAAGLEAGRRTVAGDSSRAERIVLLSDGHPTVGLTDHTSLATIASVSATSGVTVSALGVGVDFDPALLQAVSDAGGGRYHYVADGSLDRMLREELAAMRGTTARQVEVDLKTAAGVEILEVYGYDSWDGWSTDTGHHVRIGDVASGHPRKLVARVRLPASTKRWLDVATVDIASTDPSTGKRQTRTGLVRVARSDDLAAVAASSNAWAARHVARAMVGDGMLDSGATWRRGDRDLAGQEALKTAAAVRDLSERHGLVEELELADSLAQRAYTYRQMSASSPTGRRFDLSEQLRSLGYVE